MAKALNMRLLAQHELAGFGGLGEGMSVQLAKDGRRILWLAHESAPKNFTGVDVSDPRNLKLVAQTELPHRQMRSNSLEVCGDIMAVAYQTQKQGAKPAGDRAVRHLDARGAALDFALRLLGPACRAACTRSGSSMARPSISPAAPPISRRATPRTISSIARST